MNIVDRLELIHDWYQRAVCEDTGRLGYLYEPERDLWVGDGNPIRDIASIWDLALLGRFLGRDELAPVIARSLEHYARFVVECDGALVLDTEMLGEPSSIAHSAFLILALCAADSWSAAVSPSASLDASDSSEPSAAARARMIERLAAGILGQQRPDGSFKIFFGREPDQGVELYPGEAMLALMEAFRATRAPELLASVERGFAWAEARHACGARIDPDMLVFFANWQSACAALLATETGRPQFVTRARAYVLGLHDVIIARGFYDDVARAPERQAVVEVACALEGLNDAYRLARGADAAAAERYRGAIRVALGFLFRAQRLRGATACERGGFGQSLGDRTQRIDVTGHVLNGFIKSVLNGLA